MVASSFIKDIENGQNQREKSKKVANIFMRSNVDNLIRCECARWATEKTESFTHIQIQMSILEKIRRRFVFGFKKYQHGITIKTDTRTLGTELDSWLEMAEQELLDGTNYSAANICRLKS